MNFKKILSVYICNSFHKITKMYLLLLFCCFVALAGDVALAKIANFFVDGIHLI